MVKQRIWYFISGADAILEIITWKQVNELLDYAFVAAHDRATNLKS